MALIYRSLAAIMVVGDWCSCAEKALCSLPACFTPAPGTGFKSKNAFLE